MTPGAFEAPLEDFMDFIRFLCGANAELEPYHFGRFNGCEAGAAKIKDAAMICCYWKALSISQEFLVAKKLTWQYKRRFMTGCRKSNHFKLISIILHYNSAAKPRLEWTNLTQVLYTGCPKYLIPCRGIV